MAKVSITPTGQTPVYGYIRVHSGMVMSCVHNSECVRSVSYIQGACRSLKVKFKYHRPGNSWNQAYVMESHRKSIKLFLHFWPMYMFLAYIYIIIVYCQTRFSICKLHYYQIQSSYNYVKFLVKVTDRYVAQSCNFNGWPNRSRQIVLESHGRPLSEFSMHPEYRHCLSGLTSLRVCR